MDVQFLLPILELSRNEKRGVTLFLSGQALPLLVQEIHGTETVVGTNQQYSRICIDLRQVQAAALS